MLLSGLKDKPTTAAELMPPALTALLDGLDVRSRRRFSSALQGERRGKQRGQSIEFDDHRAYTAGDDLRHIDWAALARLDKLFVKVFQEQVDLSISIVIDASPSMLSGGPAKILKACQLAAALSYCALTSNSRVTISGINLNESQGAVGSGGAVGLGVVSTPPLRGSPSTAQAMSFLLALINRAEAVGPASGGGGVAPAEKFAKACATLAAARAGKGGRGVVILISDLLVAGKDGQLEFREALRAFASTVHFETHVVQILSPGELDPTKERSGGSSRALLVGDLKLIDSETAQGKELTITAPMVKAYRASVERFIASVRQFAASQDFRHTLVSSDVDIADLVGKTLRAQGLVH